MSDEEEENGSSPEGDFSASEDEWKPCKETCGGESSDDDDSDFEAAPVVGAASTSGTQVRKREPKGRNTIKQHAAKKRKSADKSLRAKLYNKYKPPPKPIIGGSPSTSTSKVVQSVTPKNGRTPNDDGDSDISSDSSIDNHLVNPADLDFMSSFFDVKAKQQSTATAAAAATTTINTEDNEVPPPFFDCNAGMQLSDSDSEDNESSGGDATIGKLYDFQGLLRNASNLALSDKSLEKSSTVTPEKDNKNKKSTNDNHAADVNALLALGENMNANVERNDPHPPAPPCHEAKGRQKLRQTKSTRHKRQAKVAAVKPTPDDGTADTDDSDWEEVADNDDDDDDDDNKGDYADDDDDDGDDCSTDNINIDMIVEKHRKEHPEGLVVHVDLPTRRNKTQHSKQQDLDAVIKRKLNREIKERQLLLHKTSLLCCFARSYMLNRLLNDAPLMQEALKLLPSPKAYPPESGTALKYYESFVTWFRATMKVKNHLLMYPEDRYYSSALRIKEHLIASLQAREAQCKQDLVFMFIILVRGMGLQCRLVVNMQPLPLKPESSQLCVIKQKINDDKSEKKETQVAENEQAKQKQQEKQKKENEKQKQQEKQKKETQKSKQKSADKNKTSKIPQQHQEANKKPTKKHTTKNTDNTENNKEIAIKPKSQMKETGGKKEETLKAGKKRSIEEKVEDGDVHASRKELASKPNLRKISKVITSASQPPSKTTALTSRKSGEEQEGSRPKLARLKKTISGKNDAHDEKTTMGTPIALRTRHAFDDQHRERLKTDAVVATKKTLLSSKVPNIIVHNEKNVVVLPAKPSKVSTTGGTQRRNSRSRSKSPKAYINADFLRPKEVTAKEEETKNKAAGAPRAKRSPSKNAPVKVKIQADFLTRKRPHAEAVKTSGDPMRIPQLDGVDDDDDVVSTQRVASPRKTRSAANLKKLKKKPSNDDDDVEEEKEQVEDGDDGDDDDDSFSPHDEDFEPSPSKKVKVAPITPLSKNGSQQNKDRRRVVLSSDDEVSKRSERLQKATDAWVEVWSHAEEQWICVDLFTGKLHSVDAIRRSSSSNMAYIYAFQNDLSIKDVTARYCVNWANVLRKARVEKSWLDDALAAYMGQRTMRDLREDEELRRIHEEKPLPTSIADYKDHPLYVLERHLLKFQALYPPNAPTLGFIRSEAVYSRDCVHLLHSREIWLKQARVVRLGEQPYKIVKSRPRWDKFNQTVIKDQPLEIFGYWQTDDYDPPTAEDGIVPRNAYGNVELFKACMLPKKTVHIRLPGLNRICKKLGIDCANAVVGFDFHQGACHPTFDGFIVCEEFGDTVTAAWYQDQEEQDRKEQEKYKARVLGNWKKLIRGLFIRERVKQKYNF